MSAAQPSVDRPVAFGLIVIGDEVLSGARTDRHLGAFKSMLGGRGHGLAWHWVLPDDPESLVGHLRVSMARPEPVFVCGGIGATPDDHTRAAAARAAGLPLVRHPEARALIEERFGEAAYPFRILMADLPEGAELVPNPVSRIPGFRVARHRFLPGFPEMAWPMAEWVLDRDFGRAPPVVEGAVEVLGVPESRLIPVMDRLAGAFPDLKVFSLPHLGSDPHVRLGVRGRAGVAAAVAALREELARRSLVFREVRDQASRD